MTKCGICGRDAKKRFCGKCNGRVRYWEDRPYWQRARWMGRLDFYQRRMEILCPGVVPDMEADSKTKPPAVRRKTNGHRENRV